MAIVNELRFGYRDRVSEESDRKIWGMNYAAVQRSLDELPNDERASLLQEELPAVWTEIYGENLRRQPGLYRLSHGQFQYIYDPYGALAVEGTLEDDGISEPRLVVAFGRSVPAIFTRKKDDYRLKGWASPTEKQYGKDFDKGHFIAHSIGGAINQAEFNVYIQCRRLNRGWSEAGNRYRLMETYCQANPGVFCFSRPFYHDTSSRPTWIEFGVLKADGELWVEAFDNRGLLDR